MSETVGAGTQRSPKELKGVWQGFGPKCAVAALKAVLNFYGVKAPRVKKLYEEIRDAEPSRYNEEKLGIGHDSLATYARSLGLVATEGRCRRGLSELQSLLARGPVIVSIKDPDLDDEDAGHSVVVYEITDTHVKFADSNGTFRARRVTWTREEFFDHWLKMQRRYLLITPGGGSTAVH